MPPEKRLMLVRSLFYSLFTRPEDAVCSGFPKATAAAAIDCQAAPLGTPFRFLSFPSSFFPTEFPSEETRHRCRRYRSWGGAAVVVANTTRRRRRRRHRTADTLLIESDGLQI